MQVTQVQARGQEVALRAFESAYPALQSLMAESRLADGSWWNVSVDVEVLASLLHNESLQRPPASSVALQKVHELDHQHLEGLSYATLDFLSTLPYRPKASEIVAAYRWALSAGDMERAGHLLAINPFDLEPGVGPVPPEALREGATAKPSLVFALHPSLVSELTRAWALQRKKDMESVALMCDHLALQLPDPGEAIAQAALRAVGLPANSPLSHLFEYVCDAAAECDAKSLVTAVHPSRPVSRKVFRSHRTSTETLVLPPSTATPGQLVGLIKMLQGAWTGNPREDFTAVEFLVGLASDSSLDLGDAVSSAFAAA